MTREEYERIGGVHGALALHAETTLAAIGGERHGIVRELFRNLVTSQGTRATREVDDLLSVFADRQGRGGCPGRSDRRPSPECFRGDR